MQERTREGRDAIHAALRRSFDHVQLRSVVLPPNPDDEFEFVEHAGPGGHTHRELLPLPLEQRPDGTKVLYRLAVHVPTDAIQDPATANDPGGFPGA